MLREVIGRGAKDAPVIAELFGDQPVVVKLRRTWRVERSINRTPKRASIAATRFETIEG